MEKKGESHHLLLSHEYSDGLAIESRWNGTRYHSSQAVVPEVMEFVIRFIRWNDGVMKRNHEKVVKMGKILVNACVNF